MTLWILSCAIITTTLLKWIDSPKLEGIKKEYKMVSLFVIDNNQMKIVRVNKGIENKSLIGEGIKIERLVKVNGHFM